MRRAYCHEIEVDGSADNVLPLFTARGGKTGSPDGCRPVFILKPVRRLRRCFLRPAQAMKGPIGLA